MAGEQSGHLDSVLENLATYTERRYDSSRNVEMAMFYPAVLFLLAIGIVGALLVYVVPDIVHVFENTGQKLPWLTAALIGLSEFVRGYAWLLALLGVAAFFVARWLSQQPDFRLEWDRRKFDVPLVRRITRANNSSRYASTLSILTLVRRAARRSDDDRGRSGRQYVAEEAPDGSDEARQRRVELARCARSPQATFRR